MTSSLDLRHRRWRDWLAAALLAGCCSLAGAQPAAVPTPTPGPGLALKPAEAQQPWRGALSALAVGAAALALAYAGLRQARRQRGLGAADPQHGPVLVDSRRISPKTRLLTVHWQGRSYLLAETGQAVQLLDSAGPGNPP